MKDLSKALGTRTLSIIYHPQKDRQIKRINQEVKAFSMSITSKTIGWNDYQ